MSNTAHQALPEHMLVTRLKNGLEKPNATFGDLMNAVLAAKAELDMFRHTVGLIGDDDNGAPEQLGFVCDPHTHGEARV